MSAPRHRPVLLAEVLRLLAPRDGGIYVDGTFGAGGYSSAILESADCRVLGIDRDHRAIADGATLADRFAGRLTLIEGRFGEMTDLLAAELPVDLVEPFEAAALDRAVLEGGQRRDSLKAVGGKLLAIGRRDRNAPFSVELVDECVQEQSHDASPVPTPLPSPTRQLHLRGRRNLGRPGQKLPAAGTVCGYSWDIMGSYGGQWDYIVKPWYFRALRQSWHGLWLSPEQNEIGLLGGCHA